MILTCPRCATRYLADDTQVWATGRTVQCGGCGQRWRAFGGGVDPRPPPPVDPPAAAAAFPADRPQARAEAPSATAAIPAIETPPADDERGPSDRPPLPQVSPAWAPPPDAPPDSPAATPPEGAATQAPVEEPLAGPSLFRTPPPRPGPSRRGLSGVGLALALVVLIVLAAVLAVVFRDPLVGHFPGLADGYRAVGLPPSPDVVDHHG